MKDVDKLGVIQGTVSEYMVEFRKIQIDCTTPGHNGFKVELAVHAFNGLPKENASLGWGLWS